MKLKGKTIGLLVGPDYEDLEFGVPYMHMTKEGTAWWPIFRITAGNW